MLSRIRPFVEPKKEEKDREKSKFLWGILKHAVLKLGMEGPHTPFGNKENANRDGLFRDV